jgi:hypothetical protein
MSRSRSSPSGPKHLKERQSEPRLQSIKDGAIINLTDFGTQLQTAATKILIDWLKTNSYGFQDGGCLMFAQALRIWSKEDFTLAGVYLSKNKTQAQHILARSRCGRFLDSDGLGTNDDIIFKMQVFERLENHTIDQFDIQTKGPIPYIPIQVEQITSSLNKNLGPYSAKRLSQTAYRSGQGFYTATKPCYDGKI